MGQSGENRTGNLSMKLGSFFSFGVGSVVTMGMQRLRLVRARHARRSGNADLAPGRVPNAGNHIKAGALLRSLFLVLLLGHDPVDPRHGNLLTKTANRCSVS